MRQDSQRKTTRVFNATILLLILFTFATFAQAPAPASVKTALDKYVEAPDPSYKYELVSKTQGAGYTTYILKMTSQTWRSTAEVDRNVWWHWMIMVKPDEVKSSKSLLYISGGNNNSAAPKDADQQIVRIATATKSVVTELRMVPNQPLTFSDDKKPRVEDEFIAYTWDKFLKTGEELWPARLPMTKAAVRAMDTVISFCGSEAGGNTKIDGFVVAGGSKRGWTTWTTAAVDKRVVAIVPLVIDLLNVEPSFRHHFGVYGYYAPAVGDYEEMDIMKWQGTPQYRALMKIEEPYEYRQRFTMPKFIINATGDQFFVPDSWQFYYNDLPGVKYLRYVPNAEHSMRGSDAWMTLVACYNAVLTGAELPQFDWKVEKDGTIRVQTKTKPSEVKLWQATNPGARDFRLTSIGPKWKGSPLQDQGDGVYVAKVAQPKRGWTAYMVEMTFPSGMLLAPFKFTTGVKVIPDVEPFADEVPTNGK
ncbi:MAG TPA: PhoPQ-activated pathogenicity-related family protein [Blastocatellia bacterium]|nr:PhoPQ-activated pathogenicity-related family protein [Blastocatellia bacterium]